MEGRTVDDYLQVRQELALFSQDLAERPFIVAGNKLIYLVLRRTAACGSAGRKPGFGTSRESGTGLQDPAVAKGAAARSE